MRWSVKWFGTGFGFGVWRNRWDSKHVIWSVAFGPMTAHVSIWETTR